MAKNGTSDTRELSWHGKPLRRGPNALSRPYDPTVTLRDPKFIREAILQALEEGDYEDVLDIYRCHLRVLNRTRAAKAMGVSRQYIHKMLKSSTNKPSMKTFVHFMKLLHDGAEAARAKAR